jgi:RHS repeat-associated protein
VAIPQVWVTAPDNEATEGADSGTYTIWRDSSQGSLWVNIWMDGTADRGSDYDLLNLTDYDQVLIHDGEYSTSVTLSAWDDDLSEGSEQAVLWLSESSNYQIDYGSQSATVVIHDPALVPQVWITAPDNEATEGADSGTYTIWRDSSVGSLWVSISTGGTASLGSDYTLNGANAFSGIYIPDGAISATITLNPIDDSEIEGSEQALLTLNAQSTYTLNSPNNATVTIADNDQLDAPSILAPVSISTNEDSPLLILGLAVDHPSVSESLALRLEVQVGVLTFASLTNVTISQGTNGSSAITLIGGASDLTAALGSLTYAPNSDFSGTDQLTLGAEDNGGIDGQTDTATILITVSAVADVATLEINNASGNEDTSIPLDISATLVDGDGSETLAVEISGVPSGAILSAGVDEGNGVWVLTAADLSGLTLTPSPDTNINTLGVVVLEVRVTTTEQQNGDVALSDPQELELTISAVNDATTVSVPADQEIEEDTSLVFSIGTGNSILIADVDAVEGNDRVQFTLEVAHGTLMLASAAGLELVAGIGTGLVTAIGSVSALNAVLEGLTYQMPSGESGADALIITVQDLGNAGSGGPKLIQEIVPIVVVAVDAPPAILAPLEVETLEDVALSVGGVEIIDPDNVLGGPVVTLTVVHGSLTVQLQGDVSISQGANSSASLTLSGSLTDLNDTLASLVYSPTDHFGGEDEIVVTLDDLATSSSPMLPVMYDIAVQVTPVADAPSVTASNASGDEDTVIPLGLVGELIDADGSEVFELTISGVPDGATLSSGQDLGDGNWLVTTEDIATLSITPSPNSDADFVLTIAVSSKEILNGDTASSGTPLEVSVAVNATADAPLLAVSPAWLNENGSGSLGIVAELVDSDGSESLALTVAGVPVGAALSSGNFDALTGLWHLSASDLVNLQFTPPIDFIGQVELEITAISTESSNDSTSASGATLVVTVLAIASSPNLSVSPASGQEDSGIPLAIEASLNDTDGSESLTVIVRGLPTGAQLTRGHYSTWEAGWVLADGQWEDVALTLPQDYFGEFELTVVARALELTSGDVAEVQAALQVTVAGIEEAPTIAAPSEQQLLADVSQQVLGIVVADVEQTELAMTLTLTVGTLTLAETTGLTDLSAGGFVEVTSVTFSGTIAALNAALASLAVTVPSNSTLQIDVDDAQSPVESESVSLLVTSENLAPSIVPIDDQVVEQDDTLTFTVHASDNAPGTILHFALGGTPPAGASIDATTGEFSWNTSGIPIGTIQQFTVIVTDDGSPAASSTADFQVQVGQVSPQVSGASVSASSWHASFLEALDTWEFSHPELPGLGAALPNDVNLPWFGIDTVSVRFSAPVQLNQDDLIIQSVDGLLTFQAAGFSYDSTLLIGTWTFASPLVSSSQSGSGTFRLLLSATAQDSFGNALPYAGETLRDTDGRELIIRILQGDVNGDDAVDQADLDAVTLVMGQATGDSAGAVTGDVNGTGTVDGGSETAVQQAQGNEPPQNGKPANLRPWVEPIAPITIEAGVNVDLTLVFGDPELKDVEFELRESPLGDEGATIDEDGHFTWETDEDGTEVRTYEFNVRAFEVADSSSFWDLKIIVIVEEKDVDEENDHPYLNWPHYSWSHWWYHSAEVDSELAFTVTASDPDHDPDLSDSEQPPEATLTFSLEGAASGATIDGETGEFSWTPTEDDAGKTLNFVIRVEDAGDPQLGYSRLVAVRVNPVENTAPALDPIDEQEVQEGQQLTFTVTGHDTENQEGLIYSVSGLPEGATFDQTTGQFDWTPTEVQGHGDQAEPGQHATYNVTFTVSDNDPIDPKVASQTVTIRVYEDNQAPTASKVGTTNARVGEYFRLEIVPNDTDVVADHLYFEIDGEPDGMTISPNAWYEWLGEWGPGGTISWTPTLDDVGAHDFEVRVYDREPGNAERLVATVDVSVTVTNPLGVQAVDDDQDPPPSGGGSSSSSFFSFVAPSDGYDGNPVARTDGPLTVRHQDTLQIEVLSNDSHPADPYVSVNQQPQHGTATYDWETGQFTYDPHDDYVGWDHFVYALHDGGASDTAYVTILVTNQRVETYNYWHYAIAGHEATFIVEGSEQDPDGESLTFEMFDPAYGQAESGNGGAGIEGGDAGDKVITYTANQDFSRFDWISYTFNDGLEDTVPAWIGIDVIQLEANLHVGGTTDADEDRDPGAVLTADVATQLSLGTDVYDADGWWGSWWSSEVNDRRKGMELSLEVAANEVDLVFSRNADGTDVIDVADLTWVYGEENNEPPSTLYVTAGLDQGDIATATLSLVLKGKNGELTELNRDTVKLTIIDGQVIDIDIDSDNSGEIDGTPEEDDLEDGERNGTDEDPVDPAEEVDGKRLKVNDGDIDADGVPDWADGYNLDGVDGNEDDELDGGEGPEATDVDSLFTPVQVSVDSWVELEGARIRFDYGDADPTLVHRYGTEGPESETDYTYSHWYADYWHNTWLRLWSMDGEGDVSSRDKQNVAAGGNFVESGVWYQASDLGITSESRSIALFVEAIHGWQWSGSISVELDPGPANFAVPGSSALSDWVLVEAEQKYADVQVMAVDAYAREGGAFTGQGEDNATFVFSRGEGNTEGELTITYEIVQGEGSQAAEGTDFDITNLGTITISEGQSWVELHINPNDDDDVEWDEIIEIRIVSVSLDGGSSGSDGQLNYTISSHRDSARVTILDDDGFGPLRSLNVDTVSTGDSAASVSNGIIDVGLMDGDVQLAWTSDPIQPMYFGHQNLHPLTAVLAQLPSGSVPLGMQVSARVTIGNVEGEELFYEVSQSLVDDEMGWFITYADVTSLMTGHYDYDVQLTVVIEDVEYTRTIRGTTEIINRKESDFGQDFWLSGLDELQLNDGDTSRFVEQGAAASMGAALIRGDHTAAWFTTDLSQVPPEAITVNLDVENVTDSEETPSEDDEGFQAATAPDGNEYHYLKGSSEYHAEWTFEDLVEGAVYQIFATWTAGPDRNTSATYELDGAVGYRDLGFDPEVDSAPKVSVDQRYTPGELSYQNHLWKSLGYFTLAEDDDPTTLIVRLSGGGGVTIADGIMLVRDFAFQTPDGSFSELTSDVLPFEEEGEGDEEPPTITQVLTSKYGTQYQFDAAGRMLRTVDRNGNQTEFEYSEDGFRLEKVTSQGGLVTEYRYGGDGLSEVEDFAGRITSYAWGSDTLVISQPDPDPASGGSGDIPKHTFVFGGIDELLSVYVDPNGNQTKLDYNLHTKRFVTAYNADHTDQFHSGWQVVSALGFAIQHAEEPRLIVEGDLPVLTQDAIGAVYIDPGLGIWKYQVDRFGYMIHMTNPSPFQDEWIWQRDVNGLVEQSTEPGNVDSEDNSIVTDYTYDDRGNLELIEYGQLNQAGSNRISESWTYDAATSQVTSYKDAKGYTVTYELDARGNVLRIKRPGLEDISFEYTETPESIEDLYGGLVWLTTDARGVATKTEYYEPGGLVTETDIGLVKSVIRAFGEEDEVKVSYEYDTNRNLAATIQHLDSDEGPDRRTEFVYDNLNRLISTVEPQVADEYGNWDNPTSLYVYDNGGRLIHFTDALGRVTDYHYDSRDRLVLEVQPEASQYAGNGIATRRARPSTSYHYDSRGNLVKVTQQEGSSRVGLNSSIGRWVKYEYDARNLVTKETLPTIDAAGQASVTSYEYYASGNVREVKDAKGNITSYEYDNLHQLVKEKMPDPGPFGSTHGPTSVEYAYDDNGNLWKTTDPLGRVVEYVYDNQNQLRFEKHLEAGSGNVLSQTEWQYDDNGNVIFMTSPAVATTIGQGGQADMVSPVTEYRYDALNRVYKTIAPEASLVDANGQLVETQAETIFNYNDAGEVVSIQDPLGRITTFVYDAMGRQIHVVQPEVVRGTAITSFKYDFLGQVRFVEDAEGNTVERQYDELGRLVSVIQPQVTVVSATGVSTQVQPTTSMVYDIYGDHRLTINPKQHVSQTNYNAQGLVIRVNPSLSADNSPVTSLRYDALGQVISVQTPTANGSQTTSTIYDNLGRVARTSDSTGNTRTEYYADGSVKSVQRFVGDNPAAGATTYTYDDLGRTATVTVSIDLDTGKTETTEYKYDPAGNVRSLEDSANNVTSWAYNELGQRILEQATIPSATVQRTWTYDAAGNLRQQTDRNGRSIQYAYNKLNQRTTETWLGAGANGYVATFAYDLVGNLLNAQDTNTSGAISEIDITLDAAYRAESVLQKLPGVASSGIFDSELNYGYDAAGQKTEVQVSVNGELDFTNRYQRDALGRATVVEQLASAGTAAKTAVFTYAATGQYKSISRYDASAAMRGEANVVATSAFTYNNSGQLVYLLHDDSNGTNQVAYDWFYNNLNLISEIQETRPVDTGGLFNSSQLLQYDETGQLLTVNGQPVSGSSESDVYGPNGNKNGQSSPDGDANHYVTGSDNRLLEDPHYIYTYDNEGNRISRVARHGAFIQVLDIDSATTPPAGVTINDPAATGWESDWVEVADGRGGSQIQFRVPQSGAPNYEHGHVSWQFGNLTVGSYKVYATWANTVTDQEGSWDFLDSEAQYLVSTGGSFAGGAVVDFREEPADVYFRSASWKEIATVTVSEEGGSVVVLLSSQNAYSSTGLYNYWIAADAVAIWKVDDAGQREKTLYEWDHHNRLVSVTEYADVNDSSPTLETTFIYDVAGRRVAKAVDDSGIVELVERDVYIFEGNQVVNQYSSLLNSTSRIETSFFWGDRVDELLAIEQTTANGQALLPVWTLADQQGTIRDYIARQPGQVSQLLVTRAYDNFGRPTNHKIWNQILPPEITPVLSALDFGYVGQQFDQEIGLIYSRARYYDPFTGQWISQDPMGFAAGDTNLYRRVGNSPANATDPSGQVLLASAAVGFFGMLAYSYLSSSYSASNEASGLLALPASQWNPTTQGRVNGLLGKAESDLGWGELWGKVGIGFVASPLLAGGMAHGTIGSVAASSLAVGATEKLTFDGLSWAMGSMEAPWKEYAKNPLGHALELGLLSSLNMLGPAVGRGYGKIAHSLHKVQGISRLARFSQWTGNRMIALGHRLGIKVCFTAGHLIMVEAPLILPSTAVLPPNISEEDGELSTERKWPFYVGAGICLLLSAQAGMELRRQMRRRQQDRRSALWLPDDDAV